MAGKKIVNKDGGMQIEDYALGTMTSSYELGSTVKGATLLTGYQTEAIKPYTHLMRQCILKEVLSRRNRGKNLGILMI